MCGRPRQIGFTLLEAMVALVIVGLVPGDDPPSGSLATDVAPVVCASVS